MRKTDILLSVSIFYVTSVEYKFFFLHESITIQRISTIVIVFAAHFLVFQLFMHPPNLPETFVFMNPVALASKINLEIITAFDDNI